MLLIHRYYMRLGVHILIKFPESAIPNWFNYRCRGPSLPNKFTSITLCVIGVFGRFLKCKLGRILTAILHMSQKLLYLLLQNIQFGQIIQFCLICCSNLKDYTLRMNGTELRFHLKMIEE